MITIQIAGHLGADPEQRTTPGGKKLWQLRVATNVRVKGEDTTIWWRVTLWDDQFDKMMPYFKKGSGIIVHGEMGKLEVYTDKNGQSQVSYDMTARVIYFPPFRTSQEGSSSSQGMTTGTARASAPAPTPEPQMAHAGFSGNQGGYDDEMPF